jgi:hypothetical protein
MYCKITKPVIERIEHFLPDAENDDETDQEMDHYDTLMETRPLHEQQTEMQEIEMDLESKLFGRDYHRKKLKEAVRKYLTGGYPLTRTEIEDDFDEKLLAAKGLQCIQKYVDF